MPPPPPPLVVVPAHHRGFRRSRALWERRDPSWKYYASREFRTALLYELQPWTTNSGSGTTTVTWQQHLHTQRHRVQRYATQLGRWMVDGSRMAVTDYLWPCFVQRHCTWWKDAGMVLGFVVVYIYILRWVHQVLDAGPVLLMVSALIAIFTVGLSDTKNSNDGMPSAYAVFNKGFQKLLGSVDADALLQQHVGGGMMMMGAAAAGGGGRIRVGGGRDDDEQDPRHHHQREAGFDENEDAANQLRRRRPRKKQGNRERNQQRRELQRQRQAAADRGFVGGEAEEEAMLQLVGDGADEL